MKACVLGLGISGKSASRFLKERGVRVVCVEDDGEMESIEIGDFDLFVPSPGIPPSHPLYQEAIRAKVVIKSEVELFLEECTLPCVGVTGTNGKTTVVEMIAHCLNSVGCKAWAVGNNGNPITSVHPEGILIIELSSFQLEQTRAKALDIAVVLNLFEDHLDRYSSFGDYSRTKAGIAHNLKKGGELLIGPFVDRRLFQTSFEVVQGGNEEMAAKVCAHFGIRKESFAEAIKTFAPLSHRLEFLGESGGVSYYNDSKGTNVGAIFYALNQIARPAVLLLGGMDKGLSFSPLIDKREQIRSIVAFGEAREKIANAVQPLLEVYQVEPLEGATRLARALAHSGDAVLLSPGCASLDRFANYRQRGEVFKDYVQRRIL